MVRLAYHTLQENAGVSLRATTQPDVIVGVMARQVDHGGVQSEDTHSEAFSALSTDIAAAVFASSFTIFATLIHVSLFSTHHISSFQFRQA